LISTAALRIYFGNLHLLKARLARRLILSRAPLSRTDSCQGRMSGFQTYLDRFNKHFEKLTKHEVWRWWAL